MEKKTDFKTLSGKAKVGYIWDYYKWHIIIVIAVAAFLLSIIYHYATYREPLLNVIMINCNDSMTADDGGFDEFLTAYGYDSARQPVSLNASLHFSDGEYSLSYNDYQVLTMLIAAGGQDLFFGTGEVYLDYASEGALLDLSEVLSPELLETYADNLLYVTDAESGISYPCAVALTDNAWLKKNNYYDTCYFGIFYQSQNLDASVQFAEFLLNYESQ